jgi:predicted metal-dependent phosphoesterase TrpH
MGWADLHIHTSASDGMFSADELLRHVEEQGKLDVIAVTEHDDLRGSLAVRELWTQGRYGFEVVTGAEITTIEGHLLALFIEEPVPSLRPVAETIEAVKKQGGVCVAAHPFTWLARGLSARDIRRAADHGLDGIEAMNTTPAGWRGRRRGKRLASELGLAVAGGSDAHFLSAVGTGVTEYAGRTSSDLRRAIEEQTTKSVTGVHPTIRELGLLAVVAQTYRGIMSTPRALGWGPTAWSFVRRIVTVR